MKAKFGNALVLIAALGALGTNATAVQFTQQMPPEKDYFDERHRMQHQRKPEEDPPTKPIGRKWGDGYKAQGRPEPEPPPKSR